MDPKEKDEDSELDLDWSDVYAKYSGVSYPGAGISTGTKVLTVNAATSNNITWNNIGNAIFDIEDLTDMFVVMMKDLDDEMISSILDNIKAKQPNNYKKCLLNLIVYPNFKLMGEKFMIERYEDIKLAMEANHRHINFEMTYGNLLDSMPGFKLLLELKK